MTKREKVKKYDGRSRPTNEAYDMVTNLSCPKCHTHVDVYHPSERLIKEYEDYDKKRKRKKIRRKK